MKYICLLMLIAVMLNGCSPTIQYVGRNYRATDEIDLYFNSADINRGYETMGRAEGVGNIIRSDYSDIQEELIKMAKRKGADGVLIYGMEKRMNGQSTNSVTSLGKNDTDLFGRRVTNISTSTTTSSSTINVLQADFIKYK
jgi:hypothetical protein